ncbi:MAG TPA: hypothetical protein VOB72_10350 [Candidatus Dormibacteraeota bacterium]|nr:hypothetical protein [Candidatus Dormibacteraeota bacterium]
MTAPVNFDFGAAQQVISEIDTTRRTLSDQAQQRASQGVSIRTTWKGPYAVRFDGDRTSSFNQAQGALRDLAVLRAKVQSAIDQAHADQRKSTQ